MKTTAENSAFLPPPPPQDIRLLFEGITNKTAADEQGNPYVQIRHGNELFSVGIASTQGELAEVKALDDEAFGAHQGVSIKELTFLVQNGRVLTLRDETGKLVAESQIQLTSEEPGALFNENEAYCYGTAVRPGFEGHGYAQVMYNAQEVGAREAGKKTMVATVRVENAASIRARLKAGFRIVGYDPGYYGTEEGGARAVIRKDLVDEPLPFISKRQAERLQSGQIPIIDSSNAQTTLSWEPREVAFPVRSGDVVDATSHSILTNAIKHGYVGTGLLRPDEIGDGDQSFFIFHNKNAPPRVENLQFRPKIVNEFGRLQEVVVSYPPENAAIKEGTINKTAVANIDNVDTIAFKEEYHDFLRALEDHGVRLVYTNVLGTNGTVPVFTRDPSFVLGDTLVIAKLAKEKRFYESAGIRRISQGLSAVDDLLFESESGVIVEGGDVVMIGDRQVAVGLGTRTNEAGLFALRTHFPDYEFIGVAHRDLHLDVLFTMVGKSKVLADITQLPYSFVQGLQQKGFDIVEADPKEQITLGCNVVALDNNLVIAASQNNKTNQSLREHGVTVIEVNMPNITKKGGGPRCMTCPTNRE